MVIWPFSPTAIVGLVHVTELPVLVHANWAELTPVTTSCEGTMSPILTLVAASGPLLVTLSTQLKAPPAPTWLTLASFTIAMSADTCCGLAQADVAGGYVTLASAVGLTSTTACRPSRRKASDSSTDHKPFSNFQPGQSMALPSASTWAPGYRMWPLNVDTL